MAGSNRFESLVRRRDDTSLNIDNPHGVPITLFANHDVPVEMDAVEQALAFVSLEGTVEDIWSWERAGKTAPFWGDTIGKLKRVVLTPDFHRGSGIPVGTVADVDGFIIPQAVGNDVCCGMRLLMTDVTQEELARHLEALEPPLRAVFFRGQREIPMSPRQREALLKEGLWGVHETRADNENTGIWRFYDPRAEEGDLSRVHFQGVLPARGIFAFGDYIKGSGAADSRDSQIGSVGGGNHFVELQVVDEILDGPTAHAWAIHPGQVTIMVHSGSVGLGHAVGGHYLDRARSIYPREMRRPDHGFYFIPTRGTHEKLASSYLDAMRNAANFAFVNRLFLGLMAIRVLSDVLGRRVESRLVYDAPHNLIWEKESGADACLHRKGACPAPGPDVGSAGPFKFTGHPVIIPGSMGAASYVLAGQGSDASLRSACHGAGRALSRGKSRHVDERTYSETFSRLRVVTPIDPNAPDVRLRRDVLAKYHDRLREEAPYAYKDVTPVVQTVEDAGIARRIARLWPLLTIKG